MCGKVESHVIELIVKGMCSASKKEQIDANSKLAPDWAEKSPEF